MEKQIEALIEAINADYYDWQNCRMAPENRTEIQAKMYDEFVQALRIEEGRKYIKIIKQGSVWGFIQKEDDAKGFRKGDILLAAGYNAPARNKARGNILDGGYKIRWTGPYYL